jgi:hypothetical protein
MGNPVEFLKNKRHQFIQSLVTSIPPFQQKPGYIVRSFHDNSDFYKTNIAFMGDFRQSFCNEKAEKYALGRGSKS